MLNSTILSKSDSWLCACCRLSFMASIGRVLFHTFRAILGPPLFLSPPAFCLVHSCQHESASHSLYRYTRWCTAGRGKGRWSGNPLSTPCSPPSTIPTLPPRIQRLTLLACKACARLRRAGTLKQVCCWGSFLADAVKKPARLRPAVWIYLRCKSEQHFNGLLTPDAPETHQLSGTALVSVRHAAASNDPGNNHILITQLPNPAWWKHIPTP